VLNEVKGIPDIGLEYRDDIDPSIITVFKEKIDVKNIKFEERLRPAGSMYAAHEWAMPTAIVVYLVKPYFETLLKEAAKDHYPIFKKQLSKLAFKSKEEITMSVVASNEGKIDKKNPFTLSFSFIYISTDDNLTFKFLFRETASKEQVTEASDYFLELIKEYNNDKSNSKLENLLSKYAIKSRPIIICYNEKSKEAMILDIRDKITLDDISR